MKEIYTNRKCGIELPDKNPNKRPNDSIDITIGVFFDGTGNNKYNVFNPAKRNVTLLQNEM